MSEYGPAIPVAIWADEEKYRQPGETFTQKCGRVAGALSDDMDHMIAFKDILKEQRFLPGGRVQSSVGSVRQTTAFNCFVMKKVPDSLDGIADVAKEAAKTMQLGGGVGYDFSGIRPRDSRVKSTQSTASGPVSFMQVFDAWCKTIVSAGHRRGAQMGCLRVDHPDIMEFITAKTNSHNLTQFNISVLVTDKFMESVKNDGEFDLVFNGNVHSTVRARSLWDSILRATWDWAEPGVIFVDRVNEMNNLYYCEDISATNPCGEQPLPEYGACLLGSFNLTKYLKVRPGTLNLVQMFDWETFSKDIPHVVRAMDNVIDETVYPLKEQEVEAKNKRRMGLGITGLANVLGALGIEYGSDPAKIFVSDIMQFLANECYMASSKLAKEKGSFPLYDRERYAESNFILRLDPDVRERIFIDGIRNSHLISIAPTGTISLTANNVSSGIEPVFSYEYNRTIQTAQGVVVEKVQDYAYREWGLKCKTADQVPVEDHVGMLCAAQYWVDSACSKTCNVGEDVVWEDFKDVYMQAFDGGAKGCTTFRANGKRFGILNASSSEEVVVEEEHSDETVVEGGACYVDLETGIRSCE